MTWVKVTDDYFDHPKIQQAMRLAPLAPALDIACICHCSKEETDGLVTEAVIYGLIRGPRKQIERAIDALVQVNRLEQWSLSTWQVHDYLEYNPAASTLAKRRAQETAKKRRQRGYGNSDSHVPSRRDMDRGGTKGSGTPDALAIRLMTACESRGLNIEHDTMAVMAWCRQIVDERVLEQFVADIEHSKQKPNHPRYLQAIVTAHGRRIGAKIPKEAPINSEEPLTAG